MPWRRGGHRPGQTAEGRAVNERQRVQRVRGDNSGELDSVEKEEDGAGAEGYAGLKESLFFF